MIYLVYISIILMALEIVLPGGIVVFLGVSTLLTAGVLYMGWITTWPSLVIFWLITSIFLLLVVRSLFTRFFEGDSKVQNVNELKDAIGAIVKVHQEITPYKEGRIDFRGSTWPARSDHDFKVNESVVILGQDGNIWIVGPLNQLN